MTCKFYDWRVIYAIGYKCDEYMGDEAMLFKWIPERMSIYVGYPCAQPLFDELTTVVRIWRMLDAAPDTRDKVKTLIAQLKVDPVGARIFAAPAKPVPVKGLVLKRYHALTDLCMALVSMSDPDAKTLLKYLPGNVISYMDGSCLTEYASDVTFCKWTDILARWERLYDAPKLLAELKADPAYVNLFFPVVAPVAVAPVPVPVPVVPVAKQRRRLPHAMLMQGLRDRLAAVDTKEARQLLAYLPDVSSRAHDVHDTYMVSIDRDVQWRDWHALTHLWVTKFHTRPVGEFITELQHNWLWSRANFNMAAPTPMLRVPQDAGAKLPRYRVPCTVKTFTKPWPVDGTCCPVNCDRVLNLVATLLGEHDAAFPLVLCLPLDEALSCGGEERIIGVDVQTALRFSLIDTTWREVCSDFPLAETNPKVYAFMYRLRNRKREGQGATLLPGFDADAPPVTSPVPVQLKATSEVILTAVAARDAKLLREPVECVRAVQGEDGKPLKISIQCEKRETTHDANVPASPKASVLSEAAMQFLACYPSVHDAVAFAGVPRLGRIIEGGSRKIPNPESVLPSKDLIACESIAHAGQKVTTGELTLPDGKKVSVPITVSVQYQKVDTAAPSGWETFTRAYDAMRTALQRWAANGLVDDARFLCEDLPPGAPTCSRDCLLALATWANLPGRLKVESADDAETAACFMKRLRALDDAADWPNMFMPELEDAETDVCVQPAAETGADAYQILNAPSVPGITAVECRDMQRALVQGPGGVLEKIMHMARAQAKQLLPYAVIPCAEIGLITPAEDVDLPFVHQLVLMALTQQGFAKAGFYRRDATAGDSGGHMWACKTAQDVSAACETPHLCNGVLTFEW